MDTHPYQISSFFATVDLFEPSGTGSIGGSVFTVINSIVGGGVVALPAVLANSGLALGNILILFMGILVFVSIKLLAATSLHVYGRGKSYRALAKQAFGRVLGKVLMEVTIDLYIIGTLTGYVNIIGTVLTPFAMEIFKWDVERQLDMFKLVAAAVCIVILWPLSSLKSITMLRFTSFLAFLCISFLTFCVIFRGSQKIALEGHAILDKIIYFNFSVNGIFASMPVVSFAYIFHAAFFPIWSSMANQTQGAVTIVTSIAITICGIVYMAIATFGYLDFGVFTKGNILINYPTNDILILVAKIGYLAVVCFAYPISAFPLRSSLDGLIFKNQPAPVWRTILGGLVVVGATYALAVLLPGGNIQVILGMTGASAGTLLAYIYPALYYIILVDNSAPTIETEPLLNINYSNGSPISTMRPKTCGFYFTLKKIPIFLFLLMGIGFGGVSIYAIIAKQIEDGNSSGPAPVAVAGVPEAAHSNVSLPVNYHEAIYYYYNKY